MPCRWASAWHQRAPCQPYCRCMDGARLWRQATDQRQPSCSSAGPARRCTSPWLHPTQRAGQAGSWRFSGGARHHQANQPAAAADQPRGPVTRRSARPDGPAVHRAAPPDHAWRSAEEPCPTATAIPCREPGCDAAAFPWRQPAAGVHRPQEPAEQVGLRTRRG